MQILTPFPKDFPMYYKISTYILKINKAISQKRREHDIAKATLRELNLMYEHQNNSNIAKTVTRKKREGIGMGKKLITKSPIYSRSRRKSKCENIQCCKQINVLKLLGFPHSMHNFPVKKKLYLQQKKKYLQGPTM